MKKIPVKAILVIFALAVFLSACDEVVEKGLKPSEDWSRGVPVADLVQGALGFYMEEGGDNFYLTWPEHTVERTNIHFLLLDKSGSEKVSQDLDLLTGRQRTPRLAPAAEDRIHMFWIRRPPRETFWELWHALLDLDGKIVRDPARLSSGDTNVGSYDFVIGPEGNVYLVCNCNGAGGIFGLRIGPMGEPGEMVRLTAAGSSPSIRQDRAGVLHMAWFEGAQIKYASFSPSFSTEVQDEIIETLPVGAGDSRLGPRIGLSEGWIYILWSTLSRSGLEAGTARTEYLAFPEGDVNAKNRVERISIIPVEDQPYQNYEGSLSLSGLVAISSVSFSSDYVYEPMTAAGEKSELVVAMVTNQNYRQDVLVQPVVVLFEEGRVKGYSLAGKTLSFSRNPSVVIDPNGNLYMAWREGTAGSKAFFATTSPEAREVLDSFRSEDLVSMMLRGGLEGFAAILLFPLALPWLIPGFAIVLIWRITRDQESLENVASRVILVIALITYQVAKILFVPTILTYTPFSAWIDVPTGWIGLLRVGIPIAIFFVGIGVAERARRGSSSTILYFILACVTDMVFTLGVYGVSFFGVF